MTNVVITRIIKFDFLTFYLNNTVYNVVFKNSFNIKQK